MYSVGGEAALYEGPKVGDGYANIVPSTTDEEESGPSKVKEHFSFGLFCVLLEDTTKYLRRDNGFYISE